MSTLEMVVSALDLACLYVCILEVTSLLWLPTSNNNNNNNNSNNKLLVLEICP